MFNLFKLGGTRRKQNRKSRKNKKSRRRRVRGGSFTGGVPGGPMVESRR